MLVRLMKSFFILVLTVAISVALIWLIVRNQSALDGSVLVGDVTRAAIDRMVERLRSSLITVNVIAMSWTVIVVLAWSWIAARANPAASTEARQYGSSWAGLYLLALIGVPCAAWLGFWRDGRMAALTNPSTMWLGLAIVFIAVMAGYFFATSLTAPPKLRIAVPGADLFYRLFRSKGS
jgi:hypothetical protein